jgi:hypothetical protein
MKDIRPKKDPRIDLGGSEITIYFFTNNSINFSHTLTIKEVCMNIHSISPQLLRTQERNPEREEGVCKKTQLEQPIKRVVVGPADPYDLDLAVQESKSSAPHRVTSGDTCGGTYGGTCGGSCGCTDTCTCQGTHGCN